VLFEKAKMDAVGVLLNSYNFSIITTYRMYAEKIEKVHASNMKFFTYPSNLRFLRVYQEKW